MISRQTRFLVTGSGGQLGSAFVDFLRKARLDVTAPSSTELDITDPKAIDSYFERVNPDILINCAAYTAVDAAESDSERCYRINRDAIASLSEACLRHHTKFIHFSTDYVFPGNESDRNAHPDGYPSEHPGNPSGVYAQSKWEGEEVLRSKLDNYLIIRVSWLCGVKGKNFVKTMRRLGEQRKELNVVSDQFGSPSFTFQVVDQTWGLIKSGVSGTYHVSSEGCISWYDFATEIMQQSGLSCDVHPIPTSEYPTPARRPAFSLLDCRKTVQLTGLPMGDWKENLRILLALLEADESGSNNNPNSR